ncbi:MAG: hypothetical protein GYB64_14505 [Chloroflexi bacterium]|nr:hypothetical protein [Chloroflexota bacterium]
MPSEQVEHAVDVFNSHPPGLVEIRAEWSDDDWSDLVESPDAFAVVDLY